MSDKHEWYLMNAYPLFFCICTRNEKEIGLNERVRTSDFESLMIDHAYCLSRRFF